MDNDNKVTEVTPDNKSNSSDELLDELRKTRAEAKERRLEAQALKEKLQAIEEEKAKANGEFQKLAELKSTEAEELRKQVESLKVYEERYTAIEKSQREELLSKLDEADREEWKAVSLDVLKAHVKAVEKYKGTPTKHDAGRSNGKALDIQGKTWDDFTTSERDELREKYPDVYNKLYNQKFRIR